MLRTRVLVAVVMVLGICVVPPAQALSVTFDFDTGAPPLSVYTNVPLSQTSGGVTADFSSPAGAAFSVQSASTTFYTLSLFSGNYLYPNNQNRNALDIVFSQILTGISLTYATVDSPAATDTPGNLQLTAYLDAAVVGSFLTDRPLDYFSPGDTFPMDTLTFAGDPFNRVTLIVPIQPSGTTDFFVDNINVTLAESPPNPAPVPEPGTMALIVAGWLASGLVKRRTK
jgi:hypothetical protein